MRVLKLWVLMLCWLPLAALAGRAPEPLLEVDLELPAKTSASDVGKAVKQALIGRRWAVAKETGSSLEAMYSSRGLMARVKISWDGKRVRSQHISSAGLDFQDEGGMQLIHPTYNKWMGNLAKDIPVFLERIAFTK